MGRHNGISVAKGAPVVNTVSKDEEAQGQANVLAKATKRRQRKEKYTPLPVKRGDSPGIRFVSAFINR